MSNYEDNLCAAGAITDAIDKLTAEVALLRETVQQLAAVFGQALAESAKDMLP
jgi:hypothetical protein